MKLSFPFYSFTEGLGEQHRENCHIPNELLTSSPNESAIGSAMGFTLIQKRNELPLIASPMMAFES